ncbi:hypothetical protein FPOAC1_000592 [Fusarium poae]|uniref:hypothetical protein n=1 Tax=Fusarium poae TaxID=36050 RepID=UPI001CE75450|nr:hypothetical protein FPOAC1_000592 [Fusarium poae]KAG8674621.1 hypothetical protein FPOAC1_000592 [Fusarium poae]
MRPVRRSRRGELLTSEEAVPAKIPHWTIVKPRTGDGDAVRFRAVASIAYRPESNGA